MDFVVNTRVGKVRGIKLKNLVGDDFFAFKGIPYAKPPVGDLRFQDPEPVESWTGIRNAVSHESNCAQHDILSGRIVGSDDCLYLNIYTKHTEIGLKKLPVMVWIHGGGFNYGHSDDTLYGFDYFMRKNVITISINYRVGILGFLNLNHEVAAGNQGLKDQVMALQWIRDNIASFGGDPDNVTIFGQSSGAAAVHYLTISSLATGLFHKAIAQSGVALNPWIFHTKPEVRAHQLCQQLGHTDRDPLSIVQFLRKIGIERLIEVQENLLTYDEKIQFAFPFGPSIDLKSKRPFLPVHPEVAAAKGIQVPMIIGHTSRETTFLLKTIGEDHVRFNDEFDKLLHPNSKRILRWYDLSSEHLKHNYLKNDVITEENVDKLIDLLGDLYFVEGIHRVIKIQVEKNLAPIYYYQFSYDSGPSFRRLLYNNFMKGASHADDLHFLFYTHFFDGTMDLPQKGLDKHKITERMIELWVNFATTGMPTPGLSNVTSFNWEPVNNKTVFRFLNICKDMRMDVVLNLEHRYNIRKNK
ncbi:carboxylesterase 5A-like [Phymastichus coffea]|uniref:carboxylesterase 5A-like n=1 Tax=Phymastichus coffea TaxID=108790 RepID=UPI00273CEF14|nr:carboxylesterase 5A-like [Phymastichus coffea]